MKKVVLTAFAALTMVAMVACKGNTNNTEAEATEPATEQCEQKCAHEGDSAACCKAAVEGMAEEATAEAMECCQKAEGQKCCKAEGKECPNAQKAE